MRELRRRPASLLKTASEEGEFSSTRYGARDPDARDGLRSKCPGIDPSSSIEALNDSPTTVNEPWDWFMQSKEVAGCGYS